MTSWRLLRYLLPFWSHPPAISVVYARDQGNTRPLSDWLRQSVSWGVMLVIVLFFGIASLLPSLSQSSQSYGGGVMLMVNSVFVLAFLITPSLIWWSVPLGWGIGPAIAYERVQRTWDVLWLTPVDRELLLATKLAGAATGLWPLMAFGRWIQVITAFGVALLTLAQFEFLQARIGVLAVVVGWVLMVVFALLYLADRAQQFALMAVTAFSFSAPIASVRGAVMRAILSAAGVWFADVLIAFVVLVVLPRGVTTYPLSRMVMLIMFGPVGGYMLEFHILQAIGVSLVTLLIREMALRRLWRWGVQRCGG